MWCITKGGCGKGETVIISPSLTLCKWYMDLVVVCLGNEDRAGRDVDTYNPAAYAAEIHVHSQHFERLGIQSDEKASH